MLLNSTAQLVRIHSCHIFSSAQLFNRAKRWFPLHVGSDFQDHIPAQGNKLTRKQFTLAPITMSSLFELAKTTLRRGVCWPFLGVLQCSKKNKNITTADSFWFFSWHSRHFGTRSSPFSSCCVASLKAALAVCLHCRFVLCWAREGEQLLLWKWKKGFRSQDTVRLWVFGR